MQNLKYQHAKHFDIWFCCIIRQVISNINISAKWFIRFNYKNFFTPIWCVSFSKNIFVLGNYFTITNFKSSLTSLLECNSIESIYVWSTGFILIILWYVLLYSFTISSNFYTYFWYWSHVFVDFSL